MVVKIASKLSLKVSQVEKAVELLEAGHTVPFIARYRREATGELNEEQLREIQRSLNAVKALDRSKKELIELLSRQGTLSPQVEEKIENALTIPEIEDLYLALKTSELTRAGLARQLGLQPLAELMLAQEITQGSPEDYALQYVKTEGDLLTAEAVLASARDIVAQHLSQDLEVREIVRRLTSQKGVLVTQARGQFLRGEFEMYYHYSEALWKIPPYRVLAINRGEKEKVLKVSIDASEEEILKRIEAHVVKNRETIFLDELKRAIKEAYQRLIAPSIERQLRRELTERAEEHFISMYCRNLRSQLLRAPLNGKIILGIGSGVKTATRAAVIGQAGEYAGGLVLDLQDQWEQAISDLLDLIERENVDVIALGNGTAVEQTERLVAEVLSRSNRKLSYAVVEEDGASAYSFSEAAQEEFPELDAGLRGSIFIARRLQDPLRELVKIDPKFIRIGIYQQEIDQQRLNEELSFVIQSCVSQVGVDLNTASVFLLRYVPGLSPELAKQIVRYLEEHGRFQNREELKKVEGLGDREFVQCAGFLRIEGGSNPLDNTSIHPELYDTVHQFLERWGSGTDNLSESVKAVRVKMRLAKVDLAQLASEFSLQESTLRDILKALETPGSDLREDSPSVVLRTEVLRLEDLKEGMMFRGRVKTVAPFGVFVDIGMRKSGLVHISQLSNRFIKDPFEVVSVGDVVEVKVINVDLERNRVALSMRL
ncbi:MAG: helix-hairpin-helix domain-containing protein [Candidatus Latescibacteria bacterium]|nr:helix-hairpin-helix domain-containing protein [Candidatus Latescibacterota bacterium]